MDARNETAGSGASDPDMTNRQLAIQGGNNLLQTDSDVTFTHMKDDHMRNTQFKSG